MRRYHVAFRKNVVYLYHAAGTVGREIQKVSYSAALPSFVLHSSVPTYLYFTRHGKISVKMDPSAPLKKIYSLEHTKS